jgi:transketolase N-terminal domain/subunit
LAEIIAVLHTEVSMATALDPKQLISFEELLMSQVVSQDALIRLLIEKGLFSKEEFLKMVKTVDSEMKRRKGDLKI